MNINFFKAKHKLKDIRKLEDYHSFISSYKLTDEQKIILDCIYLHGNTYMQIGDKLGYCERTIKCKVKAIWEILS